MPFSIFNVEQGHGCTAAVHRYHDRYGKMMLSVCSHLRQCRPLLEPPAPDRRMARLDAIVKKCERKNPAKISGKEFYMRHRLVEAKAKLAVTGERLSLEGVRDLIKTHGEKWLELPREIQHGYHEEAAAFKWKRIEEVVAELRFYREQLAILVEERKQKEAEDDGRAMLPKQTRTAKDKEIFEK